MGRYDFSQTAFYSIGTLPTNFAISIMVAALAPLLPTASALSVHHSPLQMGRVLSRITRYASIILIGSGLPLLVVGYWILRLWVGQNYAVHTLPYLRILVLANILRNMCMPYASMLVATDSQHVALASVITEAITNIAFSLYLVRHIGAIGVAYGTLIGSFVSVGMHFAISMHYTNSKLTISRARLLLTGLVRPLLIAVPSLLLVRLWWSTAAPSFGLATWILWPLSTLLLAWFVGLNHGERTSLVATIGRRLKLRSI